MKLQRAAAVFLERGEANRWPYLARQLAHVASGGVGRIATKFLNRTLHFPNGTRVIGIGSAALGGTGKTLVSIAYARQLAAQGHRVALVGHGYRGRVKQPMRCLGHEPVDLVGDDALVAARDLRDTSVQVWVGANRQQVMHCASEQAQVLVVDGVLQTKPRRLHRSVLVVDALAPWAAGACPPAGDLRLPARAAVAACDEIVVVQDALQKIPFSQVIARVFKPLSTHELSHLVKVRCAMFDICVRVHDGWDRGSRERLRQSAASTDLDLFLRQAHVAGSCFGLLSLMARPDRVAASLRARGIRIAHHWQGPDHGRLSRKDCRQLRQITHNQRLCGWFVSSKCLTHVEHFELDVPLFELALTTWLDPNHEAVLDCDHAFFNNS